MVFRFFVNPFLAVRRALSLGATIGLLVLGLIPRSQGANAQVPAPAAVLRDATQPFAGGELRTSGSSPQAGLPPPSLASLPAFDCTKYLKESCYEKGSISSLLWQSKNLVGETTLSEVQRELQRALLASVTAALKKQLVTLNRLNWRKMRPFNSTELRQHLHLCDAPAHLDQLKDFQASFQEMKKDFNSVITELSSVAGKKPDPNASKVNFDEDEWLEKRALALMLSHIFNERRNQSLEKLKDNSLPDAKKRAYRLAVFAAEINLANLATSYPDVIRVDGAKVGGEIMDFLYGEGRKGATTQEKVRGFAPMTSHYGELGGVFPGQLALLVRRFYQKDLPQQYGYFANASQLTAIKDFTQSLNRGADAKKRAELDYQLDFLLRELYGPSLTEGAPMGPSFLREILGTKEAQDTSNGRRRQRLKSLITNQMEGHIQQTLAGLNSICGLMKHPCQSFRIYKRIVNVEQNIAELSQRQAGDLLARMDCICSQGENSVLGQMSEEASATLSQVLTYASYICILATVKLPGFCNAVGLMDTGLTRADRTASALDAFLFRPRERDMLTTLNMVRPQVGAASDPSQLTFFAKWLTDVLFNKLPFADDLGGRFAQEVTTTAAEGARDNLLDSKLNPAAVAEEAPEVLPMVKVGHAARSQKTSDMDTLINSAALAKEILAEIRESPQPQEDWEKKVAAVVCASEPGRIMQSHENGGVKVEIEQPSGPQAKQQTIIVGRNYCRD